MMRNYFLNESKDRKEIGRRLKKIRRAHNLTQKEFAMSVGLSREGYGNYERGIRTLPRNIQVKIIHKTGQDPFALSEPILAHGRVRTPFSDTVRLFGIRNGLLVAKSHFLISRSDWLHYQDSVFTSFGRKWRNTQNTVFMASTLATNWKIHASELGLPYGVSVNETDWSFLISAAIVLLLLPLECISIARFARWRRQRN